MGECLSLFFITVVAVIQGLVLAGLGTGLTEGVAITPFERIKVSLQVHRHKVGPDQ